jgi:hypothetical protein
MTGLEGVIRPFVGQDVAPSQFHPAGAVNVPPVRLVVGQIGGQKTFSYSGNSSITNYMAAVHTEATSTAFDMTTGKLAQ